MSEHLLILGLNATLGHGGRNIYLQSSQRAIFVEFVLNRFNAFCNLLPAC